MLPEWVLKTFCLAGTRILFNRQQSTASACYLLYVPLTEAPAKLATKLTEVHVDGQPVAPQQHSVKRCHPSATEALMKGLCDAPRVVAEHSSRQLSYCNQHPRFKKNCNQQHSSSRQLEQRCCGAWAPMARRAFNLFLLVLTCLTYASRHSSQHRGQGAGQLERQH